MAAVLEFLSVGHGVASGAVARGQAVKLTAAPNTYAICTAASDICAGLAAEAAADGESFAIRILRGQIVAGNVDSTTDVAVGDALTPDASGNLVKTTTAGNRVIARAMEAKTANAATPMAVRLCDEIVPA